MKTVKEQYGVFKKDFKFLVTRKLQLELIKFLWNKLILTSILCLYSTTN